jgi:hypothetical protein
MCLLQREFKCSDASVLTTHQCLAVAEYNLSGLSSGLFWQHLRHERYWLVGMEYIGSKPYLVKMIHHI